MKLDWDSGSGSLAADDTLLDATLNLLTGGRYGTTTTLDLAYMFFLGSFVACCFPQVRLIIACC